jgi:trk system potassium uptake protein TrkH
MFIGASPGSPGGGIKTTIFSLLFLLLWNRLKGNEEVNIFNRTIPKELITRSIFIIFASIFSIVIITSIVLFAAKTNAPPMATRHLFIEYLFEAISAFGTVGLSMGVTPHMNGIQKLAIIILMFAGRVGPLTLALSIAVRRKKRSIIYAEEQVMVG